MLEECEKSRDKAVANDLTEQVPASKLKSSASTLGQSSDQQQHKLESEFSAAKTSRVQAQSCANERSVGSVTNKRRKL